METIQKSFLAKSYIARINMREHASNYIEFISMLTGRVVFTVNIDGYCDYAISRHTTLEYFGETYKFYAHGYYQRYNVGDRVIDGFFTLTPDGGRMKREAKRKFLNCYVKSVSQISAKTVMCCDGVTRTEYVYEIEAQCAKKHIEKVWNEHEDYFYQNFKKEFGIELPPSMREGNVTDLPSIIGNKLGINIINVL